MEIYILNFLWKQYNRIYSIIFQPYEYTIKMKNWDINGLNIRILANLRNSNKGPAPQRGSRKRRVCGAWFIKSTRQSVNFLTSVNSFYKTRPPKLDGRSRRWLRPILHAEIFDSSCARLHFICAWFFIRFFAFSKSNLNTIVKCTIPERGSV